MGKTLEHRTLVLNRVAVPISLSSFSFFYGCKSATAGIALAGALVGLGLFAGTAWADGQFTEGRSVSTCSNKVLVCAFMKDGAMRATDECGAERIGASRIVPGDCFDPD